MRSDLYINGTWRKSQGGGTLPVYNPFTEKVMHHVAAGGSQDVDLAVRAAVAAFPAWKRASGSVRGRFLTAIAERVRERKDELAQLSSLNNGKPLAEALIDMQDVASSFEYYGRLAVELDREQDSTVNVPDSAFRATLRREPVGVAGLIVPWNFPMVTTSWKVAPALAAGCTVVLKPSEVTPIVELELGVIADEVGLPPGVLNLVTGLGPDVGAALTAHKDIAKISFTGSNGVGTRVMAAAALGPKAVSLELGGKSPIVVFADADLDIATECVVNGIFFNAGQMCSATSRLLVEKSIAPKLMERVIAAAKALKPGNPLNPQTTLGPLTTKAQYDKVMSYIARGKADGLDLILGGDRPEGLETGWFIAPTIFGDVPVSSPLWREEIFGPVLCVITFDSETEAIALANDSDFGLVATVVTNDKARGERVADAIDSGLIWINSPQVIFVETSWGGFKASGIGRELGPWGLDAYLEVKHKTRRIKAA
jgi:betaine-aldehyde dehydrogenase